MIKDFYVYFDPINLPVGGWRSLTEYPVLKEAFSSEREYIIMISKFFLNLNIIPN